MALIKCKECSSEVSDTALKCPSCGFQLRKPKRGFFGKIFKFLFIVFNIIMAFWLVGGFMSASEVYQSATTDYEQAGAAIGTAIGTGMVIILWAFGDIILGLLVLFTRPK